MDEYEIEYRIKQLSEEHGKLEEAISAITKEAVVNTMELQRIKKQKLQIKDEIVKLQSMLYPDIIA